MRWLGVGARIDAILHKILHPLHRMRWRAGKTNYCSGDIICDTCNNVFWCRLLDKKEKKMNEKCINCNKQLDDAEHIITGGQLADEEWACSSECYEEFIASDN